MARFEDVNRMSVLQSAEQELAGCHRDEMVVSAGNHLGLNLQFGEPRTVELKGLTGEQEMFPVAWQST